MALIIGLIQLINLKTPLIDFLLFPLNMISFGLDLCFPRVLFTPIRLMILLCLPNFTLSMKTMSSVWTRLLLLSSKGLHLLLKIADLAHVPR